MGLRIGNKSQVPRSIRPEIRDTGIEQPQLPEVDSGRLLRHGFRPRALALGFTLAALGAGVASAAPSPSTERGASADTLTAESPFQPFPVRLYDSRKEVKREAALPLVPLALWLGPPAVAGALYIVAERQRDGEAPSFPSIDLPGFGGGSGGGEGGGSGRGPNRWVQIAGFTVGAGVAKYMQDNDVKVEVYGPGDEPDINGQPGKNQNRNQGTITLIASVAGIQNRFQCISAFNQKALLDGMLALRPSAVNQALSGGDEWLCDHSLKNRRITTSPYASPKRVQTIKRGSRTIQRRVTPKVVQYAPVGTIE